MSLVSIHLRVATLAVLALLLACPVSAAPVASASREDRILMMGNAAGSQTVTQRGNEPARAEYSFNDRGRGNHIIATWKLDARGVPTEYSGSGNDYMKAPVSESFSVRNGKASWQSRTEHGEVEVVGERFYMPNNAPPEFTGVLARRYSKRHNTDCLSCRRARRS